MPKTIGKYDKLFDEAATFMDHVLRETEDLPDEQYAVLHRTLWRMTDLLYVLTDTCAHQVPDLNPEVLFKKVYEE